MNCIVICIGRNPSVDTFMNACGVQTTQDTNIKKIYNSQGSLVTTSVSTYSYKDPFADLRYNIILWDSCFRICVECYAPSSLTWV